MEASILAPDDFMSIGLDLVGFSEYRQSRAKRSTNLHRFRTFYGSNPIVYANIWEDLLSTDIPEARVSLEDASVRHFLSGIYFLKNYPTDERQSGQFKMCVKTARKWAWFYMEKVQWLKLAKIFWPEDWDDPDDNIPMFLISVDGVHCRFNEPKHPTKMKNKTYYSHKFDEAGLAYELALSVFGEENLVWMDGPFPASSNDAGIFSGKEKGRKKRKEALIDKIPKGHKAIADNGYKGDFGGKLTKSSSLDSENLRRIKSRAKARQESFNARIKNFGVLHDCFRHGIEKHKICFEAVCVIVQYQLESGPGLFDV